MLGYSAAKAALAPSFPPQILSPGHEETEEKPKFIPSGTRQGTVSITVVLAQDCTCEAVGLSTPRPVLPIHPQPDPTWVWVFHTHRD